MSTSRQRGAFRTVDRDRPALLSPVAVTGLFGSSFSRAQGAPMSRWSGRLRAPVTVRFGAPLPPDHVDVPTLARELSRLGGQSLGDEARAQLVHAA